MSRNYLNANYDYDNYDYISVSVRDSFEKDFLMMYSAFSWSVVERKESSRYCDVIRYTFRRPHNIAGKDELQFLQVGAEEEFNKLASLSRGKHVVSAIAGVLFVLIGCLAFGGGVTMLCLLKSLAAKICGGMLIANAIGIWAISAFVVVKVYKNEKAQNLRKMRERALSLITLCEGAAHLTDKERGV